MPGRERKHIKTGCILIHGFTGSPKIFDGLAADLKNRDILVSTPLLPGHGTDVRELSRVKWENWWGDVQSECEKLSQKCDRLIIIGFSMGGALALLAAQKYLSAGVVTLSTAASFENRILQLAPWITRIKKYWKKRRQDTSAPWDYSLGYDRYPLRGVLEYQKVLQTAREKLKDIRCPALIMHAKGDWRVPFENAEILYKEIGSPKKELVPLDDHVHGILIGKHKELINAKILQFIKECAKE